MALFISQEDDRSELQKQIAAELQRKAKQTSLVTDRPDGVDDSRYMQGTKSTTSLAWVWALIIIAAIGAIIWLTVIGITR